MTGSRGRVGVRHGTVVTDDDSPLRGGAIRFFRYGLSTGATPAVMNRSFYRQLRACRLNAVRIAVMDAWQRTHNYHHWDLTASIDRADFLSKLDAVVELATAEGLYVLIDYHDEGEYDRAHVELFWNLVAPRYRDRPLVFYELLNEPAQWGPNAYTDAVLADQQQLYQLVRSLAPDTHLVLLSFARFSETAIAAPGESMLRVARSLEGIDWTNASVGVHGYGAWTSAPLTELREHVPVLCTELDLPAHAGGTVTFLNALDGAEYPQQVYEELGIGWFAWNIDSHEALDRWFRRGVLADAAVKGYLWPADRPVEPGLEGHSHILRFFKDVPVHEVLGWMGWRRSHLVLCLALACLAAFFDFTALALVVPLVQGAAQGSFDFLWHNPWLSTLVPLSSPMPSYSATFVGLVLAAFAAGVAKSGAFHALHLVTGRLYGRYSTRLAELAFRRSLLFGKAYFDANDPGALAATLDRHHDLLRLFQGLLRLVSESLVLVAYLLVLLLVSWRLTLVVLAVLPVMYLVRRWIARRIQQPVDDSRAHVQSLASQTWDTLSSVDVYQGFNREEEAARAHAGLLERIRQADFHVWRYQGLLPRAQEVTSLIALLAILFLAFAVDPGSMNIVRLLVFFFVARLALASLGVYQEVELRFASTMPSVEQFLDLFSDRGKFILPSGSRRLDGLVDSIRFQRLVFSYPGRPPVLHDVSFVVAKGKMTALVGPSGSGKTTLANLVTRAYDVQPDSVVFDGVNVRDLSLESIRRQVAVVGQDVALLNDTLRCNITVGLDREATADELARVVSAACLDDVVASLPGGLDGRIGAHGTLLSGGQRQRVAIARALLMEAPILILDEATSGIDSETEARIQQAIEHAVQGCTSLVIAHRLGTIRRADWVVVLDKGRVAEQGTLQDLLALPDGRFRAMWDAQRFD